MTFHYKKHLAVIIMLIGILFASGNAPINPTIDISGQWFLSFNNAGELNQFTLKRGYFTIKSKINDVFSARYTQDITLDKEGGDAGNVEIRMKYVYLKLKLENFKLFQNNYIEMGLVHRPWLELEQSVNSYRVQGKMFLERYKIIGSADFGIFLSGLIGGKVDENYQKNVTKKHSGKYGSYSIAILNGGGYYAIEKNNNKTIEGRYTLRPLHAKLPGLQLTYSFVYGKANTENVNDFLMNTMYASYQAPIGTFTAQYYSGVGDFSGKYIAKDGKSCSNDGYSVFGELNIPKTNFALIGRYDNFTSNQINDVIQSTLIAGVAYKFLKNKLLFDVDYQNNHNDTIKIYELVLEVGF